ncbi:group 1 truncated hemoglobin [Marinicauda salina]|uniref:Group 1 truncated hemoglobin n=1 Tax=Marinicauda salina TaxID=2135793 RepID=A0A2U2BU16_9PROT|nr:group 1 truncated hemoglobin [Marinicauda salina]PWE17489.1 group 1 truncated hemoglobin [Marinicauda salina]
MSATLFERLGGENGIKAIANDLVELHVKNPIIGPRFAGSDKAAVKQTVAEFFITGSGGPEVYKGEDMVTAHKHMNINGDEFVAALDDAMVALDKNGIGEPEKQETLAILFSMRGEVMHQ